MGSALESRVVQAHARKQPFDQRHVLGLAAMRRAHDRQLLIGETVVVSGSRFNQRKSLKRLDRRPWKDWICNVTDRQIFRTI